MAEVLRRLMSSKDVWWGPLALIMLLALVWFGWYALEHKQNLDGAALVVGGILSQLGTLINFRYGASKKDHNNNSDEQGKAGI